MITFNGENIKHEIDLTRSFGMGMDEKLLFLRQYGKPILSGRVRGWVCHMEVNLTTGVSLEISSSHFPMPSEAVADCLERLNNIANISENKGVTSQDTKTLITSEHNKHGLRNSTPN
jgi:hypothetical protein